MNFRLRKAWSASDQSQYVAGAQTIDESVVLTSHSQAKQSARCDLSGIWTNIRGGVCNVLIGVAVMFAIAISLGLAIVLCAIFASDLIVWRSAVLFLLLANCILLALIAKRLIPVGH